jgi:hypothetical protein
VFGKNAIAIVKQVFVSLFEPDGFTQLLQRPNGTWIGGDVAMDQAPAVVLDRNKHIQQTKGPTAFGRTTNRRYVFNFSLADRFSARTRSVPMGRADPRGPQRSDHGQSRGRCKTRDVGFAYYRCARPRQQRAAQR